MLKSMINFISGYIQTLTCIDDSSEEIVEDVRERLGGQHPVQGADEHRPPRVKLLGGAADKVGVSDDPRDDLNWRELIRGTFQLNNQMYWVFGTR